MFRTIVSFTVFASISKGAQFISSLERNQEIDYQRITAEEEQARIIWVLLKGQNRNKINQEKRQQELEELEPPLKEVDQRQLSKMRKEKRDIQILARYSTKIIRESKLPQYLSERRSKHKQSKSESKNDTNGEPPSKYLRCE